MQVETMRKWLAREPVEVEGRTYVFPHGADCMRRLVAGPHKGVAWVAKRVSLRGVQYLAQRPGGRYFWQPFLADAHPFQHEDSARVQGARLRGRFALLSCIPRVVWR